MLTVSFEFQITCACVRGKIIDDEVEVEEEEEEEEEEDVQSLF